MLEDLTGCSKLYMANTYSQIYIQIVFAVQGRQSLIQGDHKEEIQKYIAGIIRKQNQKLIAIGGMPDRLHALIGMKPGIALSDLVRDDKSDSSVFINGKKWDPRKIQLAGRIRRFLEEHHSRRTFKDEYLSLLFQGRL